jgi:hypothetical protein
VTYSVVKISLDFNEKNCLALCRSFSLCDVLDLKFFPVGACQSRLYPSARSGSELVTGPLSCWIFLVLSLRFARPAWCFICLIFPLDSDSFCRSASFSFRAPARVILVRQESARLVSRERNRSAPRDFRAPAR